MDYEKVKQAKYYNEMYKTDDVMNFFYVRMWHRSLLPRVTRSINLNIGVKKCS